LDGPTGAFLVAENGRRLAAPPGRSSSLRRGRSTWRCGFAGGKVAAIEECPALPLIPAAAVVWWRGPGVACSRTRAASFGGTSSTRSPAATSCWASKFPSPVAPSLAQARSGHSRATPAAARPGTGRRAPATDPAAPHPGRLPPRYASSCAGRSRSSSTSSAHSRPSAAELKAVAGMPNNSAGARASFEPRRGRPGGPGASLSSQATSVTGRRFGNQARRASSTLRPGSLPSRPGPQRHRSN
jgi:hypothetical protein